MSANQLIKWLTFAATVLLLNVNVVFYAHYQLNKAEIIELFCINKSKPRLKCDGKCHLKTTLQKAENKSNSKGDVAQYISFLVFVHDFTEKQVSNWKEIHSSYETLWQIGFPLHQLQHIFKPPV